jgi:hypothetical protein
LADRAGGEDCDAVRELKSLLCAVRYVHDGGRTVGERGLEIVEECMAGFCVEARRRLVEQEQAGLESESTGEADPLRLPARERERLTVGEVCGVEALEGSESRALAGRAGDPAPAERQFDVPLDAGRQQSWPLRGVPDAAPKDGTRGRSPAGSKAAAYAGRARLTSRHP